MFDIIQIIILLYSVVLHEVSHGLMARALGDDTAERMGRLTLNPLKHLDPVGSILLPIITKIAGGFMFGYAKPVPYDPSRLSDKRWGPAKVGLAGPAANIALALIFGLVIRFSPITLSSVTLTLLTYVVIINLVLALFNLIPVPPLDGHWLLMAVLPYRFQGLRVALYRYQWVLFLVALFVVFPALSPLIDLLFHAITGL